LKLTVQEDISLWIFFIYLFEEPTGYMVLHT